MKLRYEQPKPNRFKKCSFRDISSKENLWFAYKKLNGRLQYKIFKLEDQPFKYYFDSGYQVSTHLDCNSVKAFRRFLKRASKMVPKGTQFVLINKYYGYDVYGRTI
jgi:hypothetical protein